MVLAKDVYAYIYSVAHSKRSRHCYFSSTALVFLMGTRFPMKRGKHALLHVIEILPNKYYYLIRRKEDKTASSKEF